jgi:hypothetical protein
MRRHRLANCRAWLDALPDNAVLEPVKVKPNGSDLEGIRQRIRDAQDEVAALRAVPAPPADIRERVKEYVVSQARPKVRIESGQVEIVWPNSTVAML